MANGQHYGSQHKFPMIPGVDGTGRCPDRTRVYLGGVRSPYGPMAQRAAAAFTLPLPVSPWWPERCSGSRAWRLGSGRSSSPRWPGAASAPVGISTMTTAFTVVMAAPADAERAAGGESATDIRRHRPWSPDAVR